MNISWIFITLRIPGSRSFLLFAVDGSKAKVTNSEENRERFGNRRNQHAEIGQIQALVSGMYDILNGF